MLSVILLLLAGGIGFTQAVSDPAQVTLRWLRLGGIIAVSLLAVMLTFLTMTKPSGWERLATVSLAPLALFMGQLIAVQLAHRHSQRILALAAFLAACAATYFALASVSGAENVHAQHARPPLNTLPILAAMPLSAALLGGYLMTMLLGHAYLTAGGEMTQQPFLRLVRTMAAILLIRAIISIATGLWPYMQQPPAGLVGVWDGVLVAARYFVGLVVPGIFTYMIHDCVKRRANQSATGILYVALVLVVIGEGAALALITSTGLMF